MRPKQRKVAAKNMLELRTAEVDAYSVGPDTSLSAACPSMLQLLRYVLCQDEFSKALSPEERVKVWGRRHEVTEATSRSQTGKTSTLSCFADEEGGHTHCPTSIQTRRARKRLVV